MPLSSEPIFPVPDIVRAVRYYRDILGFEREWLWGEPPTHAGVGWGHMQIMFSLDPELASKCAGLQHYIRDVEDIDALHQKHCSAGAMIVSPPENKPWGAREYTVSDPHGFLLRFCGPEKYQRRATATDQLPAHIAVSIAVPTLDDFAALTRAVGWTFEKPSLAAALKNSIFCALATDTRDGNTVGLTRVVGDGRSYTIWDVAVLPTYQHRKIGSALIEAALAHLRTLAPKGTFVGLFTGKPEFYEKLGFARDHGMHLAL